MDISGALARLSRSNYQIPLMIGDEQSSIDAEPLQIVPELLNMKVDQ